ncbi:uncharacterized protein LOC119737425 [Patiria miniata]|uniref:CCHC-type domain-containing protein n=1 Tax=Patiria miniata TaxID=46514 RepID=A0A913ZPP5_PATMI|nr:uncharacterized protein LOC119726151 [Patiria miniata]XP_038067705.1 uncharacterized protein LOC119737425 [Patiria miniata]
MEGTDALEKLQAELEAVKKALQKQQEEKSNVASSSSSGWVAAPTQQKQIYVASGRRLERFRGIPEKSSDPTIEEWVSDVRCQLAARQLKEDESGAFILDHLAGKARQEILGRGDAVTHPEEIFQILLKVFGDGDTLPQLQQRFFSYKQASNEDLLTCSLELVKLFTRMSKLDPSIEATKGRTLKGRLAEAVRDEGLQRELRRLNIEAPTLSFFDVRDRAIEWLGCRQGNRHKEATVQEVKAADDAGGLQSLLRKQSEQLQKQQQQIDALIKAFSETPKSWRNQGPRRCFNCRSTGHLRRQCPYPPQSPVGGSSSARQQFVPEQSANQQSMYNPRAQQFVSEQFANQQSVYKPPAQQFVTEQSANQQLGPQQPNPQMPTPRQPLN